jgi:hypothetical protein
VLKAKALRLLGLISFYTLLLKKFLLKLSVLIKVSLFILKDCLAIIITLYIYKLKKLLKTRRKALNEL